MPQTPPLLIAQITDTHLFANPHQDLLGLPTVKSLQATLDHLSALQPKPDLLLLTGDLSQDTTPESYQRLERMLAPLGIPAVWVPGNHDVLLTMQEVLQTELISAEKAFQRQGWNFLLLNSAVPQTVYGRLSAESLEWLDQQLQILPDLPTLIALHHPPFAVGSAWIDTLKLRNTEALFAVIDRHPQVKLVLFGHIHQEFEHQRRGVCYLGTPSTCVQFKPNSLQFAVDEMQPGFRLLELYPDGRVQTRVERVAFEHQMNYAATGY